MEVCRLSEDVLSRLHAHELSERYLQDYDSLTGTFKKNEKKEVRCLMPFEIQEMFNLPPLKQVYMIPEVEAEQSSHNQRLRNEFRLAGLVENGRDLSVVNVLEVHAFDRKAKEANDALKIDLVFRGSKTTKGKFSERVSD